MLRLPSLRLPDTARGTLDQWQQEVDQTGDFPAQVAAAKQRFGSRNKSNNSTFVVVREHLRRMHGDLVRCAYCEDSVADEVEHLFPKDLYPEKVFQWGNYTYACGPCNGPKSNRFAIFRQRDGLEIDITPPHASRRPTGWIPTKPPAGSALLINPRREDPLNFLWLDLMGTFRLDPIDSLGPRDLRRAEYTLDLLGLNRDFLLRARRNTFRSMRDVLRRYTELKESGALTADLDERRETILTSHHHTVWAEMVRQHSLLPEIDNLFRRSPEALRW